MDYFPLARFNAHTLSDVIQWLDFADIMRLYCTGDGTIVQALSQPGTIRELRIYGASVARAIQFLNCYLLSVPDFGHHITKLDITRHHSDWKISEDHLNVMRRFSATIPSFDQLSRLILRHFPIQSNIKLPDSLTHLELCAVAAPVVNGSIAVHELPRGLLHLEIDDSSILCSDYSVEHLPPGLTTLLQREDALTNDAVPHLPRNLTRLSLYDNNKINDRSIQFLPPQLIHLDLSSNKCITDLAIPLLPRTLKSLDLESNKLISNDAIPLLPPDLTCLVLNRAKRITSHCFAFLPRGLTLLDVANACYLDETHIADLPRGLTHLDLDMCSHYLTDFGIPDLPRQLQYLDITMAGLITDVCIPHLPPSLTQLFMISANITAEGASCLLETFGWFGVVLPRHLERIVRKQPVESACENADVEKRVDCGAVVCKFLILAAAHVIIILLKWYLLV